MGPHFFKCGNLLSRLLKKDLKQRFNGAALFQVRKYLRERCSQYDRNRFNGAALFQVRKLKRTRRIRRGQSGFNGAALFQVRKFDCVIIQTKSLEKLQWGRTFSSAEISELGEALDESSDASMGPHFFKCGNLNNLKKRASQHEGFNGAALFQVRKLQSSAK